MTRQNMQIILSVTGMVLREGKVFSGSSTCEVQMMRPLLCSEVCYTPRSAVPSICSACSK
jgi:hypothetical protein